MELSKRMNAVAQMVPAGHITADVGCDHGFVSIYLIEQGICPHVYAADVRPGPLARAKEHIAERGLTAYITPVLSDGLKEVPVGRMLQDNTIDAAGEAAGTAAKTAGRDGADVMIAAGMGGRLTIRILSDVPQKTEKLCCVVLEPQSEVWLVRRWLWENGFVIVEENLVFEDGKFYPVIRAKNVRCPKEQQDDREIADAEKIRELLAGKMTDVGLSKQQQQAACEWLGPVLIYRKSAVLLSFLEHTIERDRGLLQEMRGAAGDPEKTERIRERREELKARIVLAERITEMMRI